MVSFLNFSFQLFIVSVQKYSCLNIDLVSVTLPNSLSNFKCFSEGYLGFSM